MNFYKTNFALVHHHKYSLTEIEAMIPWERFIYIDMIKQHNQYLEDIKRQQEAESRTRMRR